MSRIVLLSIVCLSILSSSTARAQVSGWEWVSPAPFGTALNSMLFLDGNTLVGAGDNGIIARSSDRGAHWDVVFTSLDIRFIGLQRRSGTLLAIGDAGAVVRSHDGGQSWLRLADAPIDSVRAIAAAAGQSFFIVGTGGVMLRSDDDGDSWQKVDFDASEDLNAVVFRDARNGVCAGAGGLIALSSDGGTNWRHVMSPTEEDLHCVAWNADGTLFLGGEQGVFLRSTDGAASWIVDGAPTRRVTAFAISDSGWGLALGDSCILRYDAAHQTPLARVFSQVDVRAVACVDSLWLVSGSKGLLTELRRNRRSIYVSWERSWLFPVSSGDLFEISPVRFPSMRLFAAGSGSLVSPDHGSSWTSFGYWFSTPRAALAMPEDTVVDYGSGSDLGRASVNGPGFEGFPVNLSFHDAMFAAVSSDGVVHQGTWRGWNLRSDDGGEQWEICRMNSDRLVYLTSFVNDTLAFADQGYGRRLLRSTDAGRHWAEFGPVIKYPIQSLHFADPDHGWIGEVNRLHRTTDGGQSWDTIPSPPQLYGARGLWPVGRDSLLCLPAWYTHDGGATWDSIRGASITLLVVADSAVLYGIDGDHSQLMRSTDGGRSWSGHKTPDLVNRYAYGLARAKSGFICMLDGGFNNQLVISEDNGHSWNPVLTLKDIEEGKLAVGGDSTIFLAHDIGRFVSTNRGRSWHIDSTHTIYSLAGLAARDRQRGLATEGRHYTLVTDDGWITARVIDFPASLSLRRASVLDDGSMVVPGAKGRFLRVFDREHWTERNTGSARDLAQLTQLSDGRFLALDDAGGLWVSRDTVGDAWEFRGGIPADSVRDLSFASAHDGLAVTRRGRVLLTSDGGRTWMECRQPVRTPLHVVRLWDDGQALIAGDGGVLLRSSAVGTLDIEIPDSGDTDRDRRGLPHAMELDAYPQPARGAVRLRFRLTEASDVSVRLIDVLGRERLRLPARSFAAGTHSQTLDLHGLPPGGYLLLWHSTAGSVGQKRLIVDR